MASENNLTAVFTDIANAIRDKKGSVDTIKPINMADEILTISSGVSVKDFITTRNAKNLFYYCYDLTDEQLASILKYDDTSSATDMRYMFQSCYVLEKIDITKLADENRYFAAYCYSLKTLIIRTMDTIPSLYSNSFNNCYHFYGTTDATYNPNGLKDGRIYVPDDKVASLKTKTNWSVFADIIKPLSEYTGE